MHYGQLENRECRKTHIPVRTPKWPPHLIFAGIVTQTCEKTCYEHREQAFLGNCGLICNKIRSVIILVINFVICCVVTDRIGLHLVLLPLLMDVL